jgi:hypothetical protein
MLRAPQAPGVDEEGRHMWPYIIGFVVLLGVIAVMSSRRGSTGASRADDLPSTNRRDHRAHGYINPGGGGDAGGSGGS